MAKLNSLFILILACFMLAGCLTRKGPPAPVSYGHQLLPPLETAPSTASLSHYKGSPPTLDPRLNIIIVGANDTLVTIAKKTGVPVYRLIELNQLKKPYILKPGQQLQLTGDKAVENSLHTEGPEPLDDFLEGPELTLSQEGVILPSLKPKRKLSEAEQELRESLQQEKIVMSRRVKSQDHSEPSSHAMPSLPSTSSKTALNNEETPDASSNEQEKNILSTQAQREDTSKNKLSPPVHSKFAWPIKNGTIISKFGPGQGNLQNDGINIAASQGTPIVAIEEGTVVYAGNEMQGFGNLILLKHPDGWMSSYGHAAKLLVERGTKVQRGQTIALVGNTGSVNEPQLHFELRNMKKNGKVVNPELYLE